MFTAFIALAAMAACMLAAGVASQAPPPAGPTPSWVSMLNAASSQPIETFAISRDGRHIGLAAQFYYGVMNATDGTLDWWHADTNLSDVADTFAFDGNGLLASITVGYNITAMRVADGTAVWTGLPNSDGALIASDDSFYVVSNEPTGFNWFNLRLARVDSRTGTIRWTAQVDKAAVGDSSLALGYISVPGHHARQPVVFAALLSQAQCYEVTTGRLVWSNDLDTLLVGVRFDATANVVIFEGQQAVFLPGNTVSTVDAFDPATGRRIWGFNDSATNPLGLTALADGVAYFGRYETEPTTLTAIDAATGKTLWTTAVPMLSGMSQSVAAVRFGGKPSVLTSVNGTDVTLLHAHTGDVIWSYDLPLNQYVTSSAVANARYAFVPVANLSNAFVYAFPLTD